MKSDLKLLVFMKDNEWTRLAEKHLRESFNHVRIICTPQEFEDYLHIRQYNEIEADWIISYLSPHIIPKDVLRWAKRGAINFHPGPPDYPGIGGYNFAIWDRAKLYGVTCHYMLPKVDSGSIIAVNTFSLEDGISVLGLKNKSMVHLLALFYEVMGKIWQGHELGIGEAKWTRKAYTRKDLQELCKVNFHDFVSFYGPGDTEKNYNEIERKLRACYFPGAKDCPYIELNGKKWGLVPL